MWMETPRGWIPAGLALLALAVSAGCSATRAELSPEAEGVQVVERPLDVKGCDSLGIVVGNPDNMREDVEAQRIVSARNRAAALGGNRIVPRAFNSIANPLNLLGVGGREFEVFRCPGPPVSLASPATDASR